MDQVIDSRQAGTIQLIEEIIGRWDHGEPPVEQISQRALARMIVAIIEERNELVEKPV